VENGLYLNKCFDKRYKMHRRSPSVLLPADRQDARLMMHGTIYAAFANIDVKVTRLGTEGIKIELCCWHDDFRTLLD